MKKKDIILDKTKIEERIKTLETEREQLRQTLVAYEGALQDCKYWLEQLTTEKE